MSEAFTSLSETFRRLSVLGEVSGVLHWDAATMMPEGGAGQRGTELAVMSRLSHEMLTAPAIPDLLDRAEGDNGLDGAARADLRWMRWQYNHAAALPGDLVEASSRASSACETLWRKARAENDFSIVRDALSEVLRLTREQASIKAEALGLDRYDALLDSYDPGRRSAEIDKLFNDLESFLPDLLGQVLERQERAPSPLAPPGCALPSRYQADLPGTAKASTSSPERVPFGKLGSNGSRISIGCRRTVLSFSTLKMLLLARIASTFSCA